VGTFDSLNIGRSALFAQRRAIDVAGQNIANVNTEGYSRQRVDLVPDPGPLVPGIFSRGEGPGAGVRSVDVTRLRDQLLEARAQREHATGSRLDTLQAAYDRIELGFGEPSDTGLAAQLGDFWAGWGDVALHPEDPAVRTQLLERASTLTGSIRQLDASLADLADTALQQLGAVVQDVNATAARIAELNDSIRAASAAGLSPNELQDMRDRLAMQLADQVGATTRTDDDGSLGVYVGGRALVRSSTVSELSLVVSGSPPTGTVSWAVDGLAASAGGQAQGLADTANVVVPEHRAGLAAVAQRLHDDVNALHTGGFDLDGNPGLAFFQIGPAGIEVNPAVAADPRKLAAAAAPGTLDGSVAARLAEQQGPDSEYRQLVVQLGVASQANSRRAEVQASIVAQVDAARESVSGVNLDEEMTDLLAFQHAYAASAQFVSVVDDLLQTLIGMVG
jgi:flagellar hook-associated protein 1 FlgK